MTVDSMEEEDAEVAKQPSIAVARKLRRKLKPISPDKIFSDDELATSDELGFGDILTRRSVSTGSSKDSDDSDNDKCDTEQKTAPPPQSLLSHEQQADENDNTHLTAQQRNAATTLNGSQCMTQYSSITNPMTSTTTTADATAQMNNLSFVQAEISMETSRDDGIIGEEDNRNSNEDIIDTNNNSKISGKRVTMSPIKGGNSSQEILVTKQLNTSLMKNDTETLKSFITTHYENSDWKDLPENAKEAAKKLGYNEEMWDSNEEPECCDEYWGDLGEEQRRAAEVLGYTKETWDTDTDDESISFGSSSSSEESSASDIPVAVLNEESTTQLQQLQSEISHRRRLLAKLLRGKEGSAYALIVQGQEDFVNSRLLDKEANDAAANATDDTSNTRRRKDPIRTIKNMLMDEYYHTLPGAFSLIIHCFLYITVYAIISKLMTWLCDVIILYRGWGANTNWFDCTNYEHLFYGIVLILSLIASRVTGIVFDWNENRAYQKRVAFQVRNKWYLKCWDALLMNFFHGGELQEKYDDNTKANNCISERCEKEKTVQHKRKIWGPRIKYVLDLISFFVCYKCVDYFVYSLGTAPSSDITELVLEKLPSRQLQEQSSGVHSVETGVSYACESVMKSLDNPYAVDMLNMIASSPLQSDEARNMILNAKKCGWSSGIETVAEEEEDSDGITGDDLWGHTISALDNKYIQEALSDGAYYDLVGDPNPRIFDPAMEMMFLIASTFFCFGLLYAFGIPFMLI